MNNREIIKKFYSSFQEKNWQGMQDCYHPEVTFSDPVFQRLKGQQAKAMWHMLLLAGKDLVVTFKDAQADDLQGSCNWEAVYSFSRTGRKVHNVITARFLFKDGKIIQHTDAFDLWRWSRMALGIPGIALGWTPLIKNKVRAMAAVTLNKFIKEHPQYA